MNMTPEDGRLLAELCEQLRRRQVAEAARSRARSGAASCRCRFAQRARPSAHAFSRDS